MKRYIEREYALDFLDPRWWIQAYWISRQFLKFQLESQPKIFWQIGGRLVLYCPHLVALFLLFCLMGFFDWINWTAAYGFCLGMFVFGFLLAAPYFMIMNYSLHRLYARTDYRKQKFWKERLAFKRWLRKKYAT